MEYRIQGGCCDHMKSMFLSDRIDIHIEVPLIEYKELRSGDGGESSKDVRERVKVARGRQRNRFGSSNGVHSNSMMPPRLVEQHCALDSEGADYLEQAMDQLNFSARAHDRILKVARTIADLDEQQEINSLHVMEAVQYRALDRKLML